jgi:hypothetical protein
VYVDDFVEAMGLRTLIGKGKIPPRADWLRRHARCGDVRDLAFVCDLGGARNGASLNFAKYDDMQEASPRYHGRPPVWRHCATTCKFVVALLLLSMCFAGAAKTTEAILSATTASVYFHRDLCQ